MWNIIEKKTHKLYISDQINLEIKVFDRHDYSDIYLNYKGYNILFSMGVWGFGMDLEEWDIQCELHGDTEHLDEMYYSVDKKNERALVDLIFFFLNETNADGMISEEYKIKNW
ncbi:MAG TPA: hypothetical protein DDW50_05725 [Firmicutes bacterium]|jgi:hypothetical protein|nr:hypothetical protein [Bacillota bacterium]